MKYLILLLSFCLTLSLKADIRDIPKRDLDEIKSLFERFIFAYDFGYTIFGSKPMSLADMCLKIPPGLPIHRHLKARFLLTKSKRRLNTWYKYKNEFEFKDFILLDTEEETPDCFIFILINKKNLLEVLHTHESIFKQELGESFNPESFLEILEKREITLAKATNDSHRLLGIMLGYGARNATLFQERVNLTKAVKRMSDEELIRKLEVVESQIGDFNEFEEDDPMIPPLYFLADISHPETVALKKRYAQDREAIERLMKKPRFMDLVLKRLLTHQSEMP